MKKLNSYKKYQSNCTDTNVDYITNYTHDTSTLYAHDCNRVSGYINASRLFGQNMVEMPSVANITFQTLEYKSHFNVLKDSLRLALIAEEKLEECILEEYIQENFDKSYIQECNSYIYQKIQDKAYDITYEVIDEAKEEYYMNAVDEDSLAEYIMDNIDFNSLYDLVEDIFHAPITMAEKLSEIGMSNKDFL